MNSVVEVQKHRVKGKDDSCLFTEPKETITAFLDSFVWQRIFFLFTIVFT